MKSRKIASAFLAAMLAVSAAAFPVSAEDEPAPKTYSYGDINGDGKITVSDAVLIARIIAEDTSLNLPFDAVFFADANQDGQQDSGDLTDVLRYIAGLLSDLNYKNVKHSYAAKNLTENITLDESLKSEYADGFRASQLAFTANMLRAVAKQEGTEKNLLISPYSIAMALGMTANGAKSDTLAEMEEVLGGKLGIEALNQSYRKILLDSAQNTSQRAQLDIANSIWYHADPNRLQIPKQFLEHTVNDYRASLYAAENFDLPVIQDINAWVAEHTHHMIDSILPENQNYEDVIMVLVNALAFEADWGEKFLDTSVSAADFTLADGSKFRTDLMFDEESSYFETEKAIGFKKYYAGYKYSYIAMLPDEDISVGTYTAQLDEQELTAFLDSETTDYDVQIAMPKYTYDFSANLNSPLKEMGMPTAFDNSAADFTGLNTSNVNRNTYISDVLHKTHITVDESGTKAGAVTAVIMAENAIAMPKEVKNVRLDRPFLYMLYDEEAKLPIFIGTVMKPSAAAE